MNLDQHCYVIKRDTEECAFCDHECVRWNVIETGWRGRLYTHRTVAFFKSEAEAKAKLSELKEKLCEG